MQNKSQHLNNSSSSKQSAEQNQKSSQANRQNRTTLSQSNNRQSGVGHLAQSDLDSALARRKSEARRTLGSALAKSASIADNSGRTPQRSNGSKDSQRSSKGSRNPITSKRVQTKQQSSYNPQQKPNTFPKREKRKIKGSKDDTKELNEVYSNLLSDELNRYVSRENEERKEVNSQQQKYRITIDWGRIVEGFRQIFYRSQKVLKGIATVVTCLITIACGTILFYAFVLSFKTMPALAKCYNDAHAKIEHSTKSTFKKEDNSFVYDKDGNTLAKLRQARDTDYVKYDEIP